MPITKSAAKRMRQNLKAQRRNVRVKRAMKSEIKAVLSAIAENDKNITDKLKSAQSKIDKAVKAGLLHKNTAARKKSQLNQAVKKVSMKSKTTAAGAGKKTATKKSAVKKS